MNSFSLHPLGLRRRHLAAIFITLSLCQTLHAVPHVSDVPKSLTEDEVLTFAAGDFLASYGDTMGLPLTTVRIGSLPAHGTLKNAGVAVTSVPLDIPIDNISDLSFTPGLHFHGSDSFQWTGSNGFLFDISPAAVKLAVNPTLLRMMKGGRVAPEPSGGYRIGFTGKPGVIYAVQYTDTLLGQDWHPLATATTGANALLSIVDIPPAGNLQRFYRMALPYENHFTGGLGAVSTRGFQGWEFFDQDMVILSRSQEPQRTNSIVFEGIPATPALNGFVARFKLAMGPFDQQSPADGVSFAVGNLGDEAWGEAGPSNFLFGHFAVGFDTYESLMPGEEIGIHVWVNGTHLGSNDTNPFTNGEFVPVEISYYTSTGLNLVFNGAQIFTNVALPSFAFPANGKFGFGARTGGLAQDAFIDDVVISPR